MSYLNFNKDQFVIDRTPHRARTVVNLAWIRSLIEPINSIYEAFVSYCFTVLEKLRYNSQTIVMEGLINDYFDPVLRRIYIVTASEYTQIQYLYFDSENNAETYTFYDLESKPALFSKYGAEAPGRYDFYVNIPAGLVYDQVEMIAKLNQYKLISKRYLIQEV